MPKINHTKWETVKGVDLQPLNIFKSKNQINETYNSEGRNEKLNPTKQKGQ